MNTNTHTFTITIPITVTVSPDYATGHGIPQYGALDEVYDTLSRLLPDNMTIPKGWDLDIETVVS